MDKQLPKSQKDGRVNDNKHAHIKKFSMEEKNVKDINVLNK